MINKLKLDQNDFFLLKRCFYLQIAFNILRIVYEIECPIKANDEKTQYFSR